MAWRWRQSNVAGKLLPHLPSLYNFALSLAGPSDAEDLVQATVLKAVEWWDQLQGRPNVRTWLFVVLRNAWIDLSRQRARNLEAAPEIDMVGDQSSTLDPEQVVVEREWAKEVRQALQALPEVYRTPLYLRDVEGFSYKEIAEILGCPVGTVMSRLARGRSLLRSQLLGQLEERGWQRSSKQRGGV